MADCTGLWDPCSCPNSSAYATAVCVREPGGGGLGHMVVECGGLSAFLAIWVSGWVCPVGCAMGADVWCTLLPVGIGCQWRSLAPAGVGF